MFEYRIRSHHIGVIRFAYSIMTKLMKTCVYQARSKQISGGPARKWVWFMGGGGGLWELIGKVHLCQDDLSCSHKACRHGRRKFDLLPHRMTI